MKFLLLTACCILGMGDRWPGFLGAGNDAGDASSLPLQWGPEKNIAWTVDLPGHGQSSPVAWDGRVFVTSVEGPNKDHCLVHCYQISDGSLLWKASIDSSDPVKDSLYVSRAAPTPVVDGNGLYAFFESGDLVAYTLDGKQRWKRSLSEDYGKFKNEFGLGASLAQTDDRIFALVDDDGPSYVVAIGKNDGEVLWKRDRTPRRSWSSPAIITVDGKPQLVVSSAGPVIAYDPETGADLWEYSSVGGNTGTTPIDLKQGRIMIAAGEGRDGKDVELARKSNVVLQIERGEHGYSAKPVWYAEGAAPSWASPIEHQGCTYWVNRAGVVFCFDTQSGALNYKQRTAQSCWATPFPAGDRVYFFGKDGTTTILASGPKFEVLSENKLWDPESLKPKEDAGKGEPTEERRQAAAQFSGPIQYGYSVVGGNLLIRTGEKLYCVRESK